MLQKSQVMIIMSPTTLDGIVPFQWDPFYLNLSHRGLPAVYDFDWYLYSAIDFSVEYLGPDGNSTQVY